MALESETMLSFLMFRGEWFIVFMILFGVVGIPLLIGGVIAYTLWKNKVNRAAWLQLAKEIQFRMPNPKKLELLGNYNGIETRLAVGMRRHGSGEERYTEYFTYCNSRFTTPLRFALRVSSPRSTIIELFKGSGTPLGHDAFDRIYGCVCYDAKILRRLLLSKFPSRKTSNLMGDLMLASESYDTIKLTDTGVYIETNGHIREHEELKHLLMVTNRLAKRFADARKQFPPEHWEKQLLANWTGFAAEQNLRFDRESNTLEGTYNGYALSAGIYAEPGVWKTNVELRFPEKLMVGFNIYPEAALYKAIKLFGFQDIKTGHRDFDHAFIVKAKNVQVAKAKMTPQFCDQLVGLKRNASALELNDEKMRITVDRVLGDAAMLSRYIDAMGSAMSKLR